MGQERKEESVVELRQTCNEIREKGERSELEENVMSTKREVNEEQKRETQVSYDLKERKEVKSIMEETKTSNNFKESKVENIVGNIAVEEIKEISTVEETQTIMEEIQ